MGKIVYVLLLGLIGCASVSRMATPPKSGDPCPESTAISCAESPDCTFDRDRGCMVCVCASPGDPPN